MRSGRISSNPTNEEDKVFCERLAALRASLIWSGALQKAQVSFHAFGASLLCSQNTLSSSFVSPIPKYLTSRFQNTLSFSFAGFHTKRLH